MGDYRNITSSSYSSFKQSRGIDDTSTFSQMYKSRGTKKEFLPKNIDRESRDGEIHPLTTPIMLGIDSTGSMSRIYEIVAKKFETAVVEIFNRLPVTDPQIMFAAIDDVEASSLIDPLQVTQFEVDNKIAEQLFDLYFTGHGCGNGFESYQLLWYFASRHTKTDAWEKRGKKGVLITVGDDGYQKVLKREDIEHVFGDTVEKNYSAEELLAEVNKKYDVYHICLEQGSSYEESDYTNWKKLIGSHALKLADCDKLPELIVSILEIHGGKDVNKVAQSWDGSTGLVIREALGELSTTGKSGELVRF